MTIDEQAALVVYLETLMSSMIEEVRPQCDPKVIQRMYRLANNITEEIEMEICVSRSLTAVSSE
jgi:hypothetical protein